MSDYLVPTRLGGWKENPIGPRALVEPDLEPTVRAERTPVRTSQTVPTSQAVPRTTPTPQVMPNQPKKRRPPRSVEERLLAAEKVTGVLREKVAAQREKLRGVLIAELYETYGVEEFREDPTEALRIQELRARLGLR